MSNTLSTIFFSSLFMVFVLMMFTPLYVLANVNIQPSYYHALVGLSGIVLMLVEFALLEKLDE